MSEDFSSYYESQYMTFGEIHSMFISQIETENLKQSLCENDIMIILIDVINNYYKNDNKEPVLINDFDDTIKLENLGSIREFMTFHYKKLWKLFVEEIRSQDIN